MKWSANGRARYESTGTANHQEATRLLRIKEGAVAAGRVDGALVNRTRLADLVPVLQADYNLRKRRTWKRRTIHIDHLSQVFGGIRLKNLTSALLQSYVDKRLGEGVAPATVNRELDCFHRMLRLGQRQTPALVGPTLPVFPKLKEENIRQGFFTHEEFLKIRDRANPHIRLASIIAYYTGMRKGEILGLRWDTHYDGERGALRLGAFQTKNDEGRVVYLYGELKEAVLGAVMQRARYPHCEFLVHNQGRRVVGFDKAWKGLMAELGLGGHRFHDFRRCGVRNLIRAGVPESVAMRISGHKTRSVFERYNITDEKDLQDAAHKMEAFFANGPGNGQRVRPEVLSEAQGVDSGPSRSLPGLPPRSLESHTADQPGAPTSRSSATVTDVVTNGVCWGVNRLNCEGTTESGAVGFESVAFDHSATSPEES